MHPSSFTIYNEVNWDPSKPQKKSWQIEKEEEQVVNEKFLKSERKSNGNVSIQARRKIGKAIDYLITTASEKKVFERVSGKTVLFKVAFITLTLPSKQIHDDKTIINKCLNSFLLEIKQVYNVTKYLWRAEKQKNGNLHFHILTDKFIPYYELRNRWNRVVNKLGYVDRYRDELKKWHSGGFRVRKDLLQTWDYKKQLHAYKVAAANDFGVPNSTDIHSTKKVRNIKKYVMKYMSKNESIQNQQPNEKDNDSSNQQTSECNLLQQDGRIWGCSHNLSKITGFKSYIDREIESELRKLVSVTEVKFFESTYFTVYYVDFEMLQKAGCEILFKYFTDYLFEKFSYSYQQKLAA